MSRKIRAKDIDELIAFLPVLQKLNGRYTIPGKHESQSAGTIAFVMYSQYADEVSLFFELAAKECWLGPDYLNKKYEPLRNDISKIKNATLDEIKNILTWCVRGERFCSGHWSGVLSDGLVFALLERLRVIRNNFAAE